MFVTVFHKERSIFIIYSVSVYSRVRQHKLHLQVEETKKHFKGVFHLF